MEDLNSVNKRAHKITLLNRRTCNLTGVNGVLSFDVNEIILETDQGMLMIKGSELHVNRLTLDKGEVDVEGKIDSFTYSEQAGSVAKGESLLSRIAWQYRELWMLRGTDSFLSSGIIRKESPVIGSVSTWNNGLQKVCKR